MSWTTSATTVRAELGKPVVHDGRIVWLWHHDRHGQVYDPASDAWTPLAADPFSPREGSVVASVGGTLVAWGGTSAGFRTTSRKAVSGGMRLDGGSWRAMATASQPSARAYAAQVWTGRELVVWGGSKGAPIASGSAYDPAADRWRKLSTKDAPTGRGEYLWSGTELWLWGGAHLSRARGVETRMGGFAYDPATDRWRKLADVPGREEDALNARAIAKMADGALYVRREQASGSDDDRCAAWRYEPTADLWEPCTPPPEVRGGDPVFVDCDGRIVLSLAAQLFEYLPRRDAWARLPSLPDETWNTQFAWAGGQLHAFLRSGAVQRLTLPEAGEPIAAVATAAPAPLVMRTRPHARRGSPVTALAIAGDDVLVGHADGSVHRGDEPVRDADGARVLGLAFHDGAWACLVGKKLEVAGKKAVTLPFEAHLLAQDAARLAIAGAGAIATLAWAKGTWAIVKTGKVTGTTSSLSLSGDAIARVVLGPARKKGQRAEARDTVEVLDAATLKVRATFAPTFERGTTSVVATADGAVVSGCGGYHAERYAIGKKRPVEKIHTDSAWSSPIVADGGWRLVRNAGRGVELFDGARRDLLIEPFEYDETLAALHPLPAFLPPDKGKELAESVRFGGAVSAIAIGNGGKALALGLAVGATLLVDRDSLGMRLIPATGRAQTWQPACSEVVGHGSWLALAADVRRGVVCVLREDGRFGELDVATGAWSWGPTLPVDTFGALRDYEDSRVKIESDGETIVVYDARSAAYDARTGTPKPARVRAAPRAEPDAGAVATLDGVHVAVPVGDRDRARRWRIHAGDLTRPVRELELPMACAELAMLPGGVIVANSGPKLVVVSGTSVAELHGHGDAIEGRCAKGGFLVTWDRHGLLRRWSIDALRA